MDKITKKVVDKAIENGTLNIGLLVEKAFADRRKVNRRKDKQRRLEYALNKFLERKEK